MTLRALIVEDEPAYAEALEVALEKEGFVLESAADGRTGLSRFRDAPPDIVLLDLMLPEISGLDVLRRIRDHSDTPVIVLSAKDAEADVVARRMETAFRALTRMPARDCDAVCRSTGSCARQSTTQLALRPHVTIASRRLGGLGDAVQ